MKLRKCLTVLATISLILSTTSQAQETDKASKVKDLAAMGPGVHNIKKDDNGRLKSLVIVGQSRISIALGEAKGKTVASKRARMNAQAEFVRWMEANVKAVESMDDETIMYLESNGAADPIESGKATEITKDNVETIASGVVRGMNVIGVDQDADQKILSVVMGWSPANAALAADAKKTNNSPDATSEPKESSGGGTKHGTLDNKTVVNDPEDFL